MKNFNQNELSVFNNAEFGEIRVELINGEPWFVGKDVAISLGYKDPKAALRDKIDPDEGVKRPLIDSMNRVQEAIFINESGLYSLIMSSKLESAKRFKKWVTSEVLPSIRKTGSYSLTPTTYLDALKALVAKEEERLKLENKNKELIAKNEELVIANCNKTLAIKDLRLLAKISIEKSKSNNYINLEDHPDYTTTSGRKIYKSYDYEYDYTTLKVLSSMLGYDIYYTLDTRFPRQLCYPNKIFDLYEYLLDEYWDELGDKDNKLVLHGAELARYLLIRIKELGLESEYRNHN